MPRTGVEYASDQITVYRGCPYGCAYCWAWRLPVFAKRIASGRYDPVREARKYLKTRGRTIVVSFTSDPYPPQEVRERRTRRVLEILAQNPRNRVLILTKNPMLALRDLDLMLEHGDMWLGTTITALDPYYYSKLEPGAPSPQERLYALRIAKRYGAKTWLSVEPIIPDATGADILFATVDYVDWYVLGALNYADKLDLGIRINKRELAFYYRYNVPSWTRYLGHQGKPYHIKRELKRYLEAGSRG